eukprot:2082005-Pleurochrysis_carterae.AAC.1
MFLGGVLTTYEGDCNLCMHTNTILWKIRCGHAMCRDCLLKLCELGEDRVPDNLSVHDVDENFTSSESDDDGTCETDERSIDSSDYENDNRSLCPSLGKCPFCRTSMSPWF